MSSTTGPSTADLDHGNNGPRMIAAAFTTWTMAFVFVLLRLWTRTKIVPVLGLSDLFIVLALMAAAGMCISMGVACSHGLGKHIYDIDIPVDYDPLIEAWWCSLLFYTLVLGLTKVSICLLYLTIFTLEWARRACWVVLAIVIISNLWAVATIFTYCIPLQATWDASVVASFCQSQNAWWANTALLLVTDLMIFILPIPIILPLKLPRRQKLIVVAVFAVGFFVCLVSFIRLVILIDNKRTADPDFTYNGTTLFYWTVVEVHTAIVVACIMTLKPLLAKFLPNLLRSRPSLSLSPSCKGAAAAAAAEPSATSSDRPLTIGSKPSRHPRPGGNGVAVQAMDEVMLSDVEGQMGGGRKGPDKHGGVVVLPSEPGIAAMMDEVG